MFILKKKFNNWIVYLRSWYKKRLWRYDSDIMKMKIIELFELIELKFINSKFFFIVIIDYSY